MKIDPKAIGVGQYQHDMNQKRLTRPCRVVEDCVNSVGVDLNTASPSLLQYVSGISASLAKSIVEYRESNGKFTDRQQLLNVKKLGPKAFEQCAGFLRITDGSNPRQYFGSPNLQCGYETAGYVGKQPGRSKTGKLKSDI